MKTKRSNWTTLLAMLLILLATGCEENGPKKVTLNFEADFYTQLVSFEESTECIAPRNYKNTQAGTGTATLLGEFSTTLTFCVNPANFEYENVQGAFVNESGEEIYVTGGGQVVPTDKPGYDLEFKDPMQIIGGTGRFAGATGNLVTDSYVNMTTGITDHIWSGKITLIK